MNQITRRNALTGAAAVSATIALGSAGDTGAASKQVLGAAQALTQQNRSLRGELDKFVATVKAN